MAAGRVEEEGGTGICADQIWPDLLTCFVLALLLLMGFILLSFRFFFFFFLILPYAELSFLRAGRPL